jgi:putative lumazine-binding protein
MVRKAGILAIVVAGVAWAAIARAQDDRAAVERAALDYVEGVYEVKPDRIQRSVHPSLVKRGFYKKDASAPYTESPMTFDQLVALAGNWNKEGKRDTSIKKVEVLDVLDQTAAAKVTAVWGVDYLLLARYDGTWKITQILWQSPPPKK